MKNVLCALAVLAVAGLAGGDAPPSGGTIKVGLNVPLSGSIAPYGRGVMDGAKLRVKQINDAGGINGAKIELVVEDNKGEKTDTRNVVKKLADIDKVNAIVGPITSSNAFAAKLDAAQYKLPVISPTATNDKVTANCEFMFRACFNDSFQGRIVANYALKQGIKQAAIMTDKNSDYSKGLSASFKKSFEAGGGKVVADEGYQQKDTNFGAQLTKIKSAWAELIFVPGYPPEVPLIIKQAKVVGFAGRLCGADGWDSEAVIQNGGENIDGCWIVGAFSPQDERPIVQKFVADMKANTGRTPGTFEALGYDSVLLLEQAAKNGTSREQLAAGLRGLKEVDAVTGRITMAANGDAEKNAVILKIVKDGEKYATRYVETVKP